MGIIHTTAEYERNIYILSNYFIKRAALKFLKDSKIKNKDEILKSYKKEMRIQAYPTYILFILVCVFMFLMFTGSDGNGYMAVPKMLFGVRQNTIGLVGFTISFVCCIIWIVVAALITRKEIYNYYIAWFKSASDKELSEAKNKEAIFKKGKLLAE